MMSRRDYRVVADVINQMLINEGPPDPEGTSDLAADVIIDCMVELSNMMCDRNPRFDPEVFRVACLRGTRWADTEAGVA